MSELKKELLPIVVAAIYIYIYIYIIYIWLRIGDFRGSFFSEYLFLPKILQTCTECEREKCIMCVDNIYIFIYIYILR